MRLSKLSIGFTFFLLLISFQNCSVGTESGGTAGAGSPAATNQPFSNSTHYFRSAPKIIIEVYYEPGAEPYAGQTNSGMPYWKLLEDNLNAIFNYRLQRPVVVVPKVLNEMFPLPLQNKTSWLGTEIVALNSTYKQAPSDNSASRFYVYFLNGNYNSGSGPQTGVIGVSITGTPVIAIFKSVVKGTGAPLSPVPKYVEQSTLVHEMGHALGFVNNGVPLSTAHQDTSHESHTVNSDCVMYWQNEGAGDLSMFVQKFISTGSTIMWGPEVLSDAQNFSR